MSATQFTRLLLTGTFLVGCAGSAFALDGNVFAKTLNAAYAASGGKLQFSSASVEGDKVVLHDAVADLPGGHTVRLGDLTFAGVEESDGGGYTAETLTVPDIDAKKGTDEFSVKNIKVNGIDIPPIKPTDGAAPTILYQTASAGPITASGREGEVFSAKNVASKIDRMDNDAGFTSSIEATGLAFHLDHTKDAKFRQAAKALGYQTVTGRFDMKASWTSDEGRVQLSKYTLALDNVGTVDMTLDLTGYTREFMKSLKELQARAMAKPGDKSAQQALGLGMLGLMQQLSFGGMSLRFDDNSITKKLLAYAGKEKGLSADQMAGAAKAMLPLGLAKLKNPQFQQEINDAVGKFLDDPKNIEIKAAPDKPVAFPTIMGSAMAAPQTLPDVLNMKVTANQ